MQMCGPVGMLRGVLENPQPSATSTPLLLMHAAGVSSPGPRWCPFPQPEGAFYVALRGGNDARASLAPLSLPAGPQASASSPWAEGLTT